MLATMLELIVFDLAGTTVRDDGQVPEAFADALAKHGIEVSENEVRALRGASKREAIFSLTPPGDDREARAGQMYRDVVARLARGYRDDASAIEGAEEAFSHFRGRGVKVALNTGFDGEITALLVDALGWAGKVDVVVCGDDVSRGRPAPDLIHAAMARTGVARADAIANVGDTVLDLRAANAAGVGWSIGVLSGAHDRESMNREPHAWLVDSVRDVPGLCFDTTG
jgi:phosphoglycolate phosphatase